jgi:lysozyme
MIPRHINVIDMYHGNNEGKIPDFAALKANGVFGIIHKASQGTHFKDGCYKARRRACVDAGLYWGAYHFLDGSDAETQAAWFLECAGLSDPAYDILKTPLLLACDYENSDHQPTLRQCMEFMRSVDRAKPDGLCWLYSGNLIRETLKPHAGGHLDPVMIGAANFFQNHPLWLAEYGPKIQLPWPWGDEISKSSNEATPLPAPGAMLWQFTEKGRVNPLIGNSDGNFFDGTFEDLGKVWI